jgi:hypothetical protein
MFRMAKMPEQGEQQTRMNAELEFVVSHAWATDHDPIRLPLAGDARDP